MHLSIKNMVCNRCILVVQQELEKLGIHAGKVTLGEVETADDIPNEKLKLFQDHLAQLGFEILDSSRQQLIEKIKTIIIQHIHHAQDENPYKFSDLLSKALHKDYSYLSGLFSDVEGTTIEKYIIRQKIEKVKELIIYDELSLSQIAFDMGYSSVAHLSNQFKKVTGLAPSHFRKVGQHRRKPLDEV